MLDSCHQLRASCLSGVVKKDHNYLLREYLFLLLWLARETVGLTYLGLADNALVNLKLDKFSEFCDTLLQVTDADNKATCLVSHGACNDPCPGAASSPVSQFEYMQDNSEFRRLITSTVSTSLTPPMRLLINTLYRVS